MTTRRVSREARREEIARRLFAAAERLLAEGTSFAAISVEQLITGAAIARSTFYVYFEDKGALVLELADRVTRQVGEAASAWFKLESGVTRDELRGALRELVDEYARHRHLLAAVAEAAAYDARVRGLHQLTGDSDQPAAERLDGMTTLSGRCCTNGQPRRSYVQIATGRTLSAPRAALCGLGRCAAQQSRSVIDSTFALIHTVRIIRMRCPRRQQTIRCIGQMSVATKEGKQ